MTQTEAMFAASMIAMGLAVLSLPILDLGRSSWVRKLGLGMLIVAGLLLAPVVVHVWLVAVLG